MDTSLDYQSFKFQYSYCPAQPQFKSIEADLALFQLIEPLTHLLPTQPEKYSKMDKISLNSMNFTSIET